MSLTSDQIRKIKERADQYKGLTRQILLEAADTIEILSAKLSAANMERSRAYYNDGWIPCSERLPEEKINPITKDFCEYQVTFKSGNIKDIRHYKFGRGHWWNGPEMMDEYVTAWRMYITPYEE